MIIFLHFEFIIARRHTSAKFHFQSLSDSTNIQGVHTYLSCSDDSSDDLFDATSGKYNVLLAYGIIFVVQVRLRAEVGLLTRSKLDLIAGLKLMTPRSRHYSSCH